MTRVERATALRDTQRGLTRDFRARGHRKCAVCDTPTVERRQVESWSVPCCRGHASTQIFARLSLTGVRFEAVAS